MRWNVVSLFKDPTNIEAYSRPQRGRGRNGGSASGPIPSNTAAAEAALDRLEVPPEAAERMSCLLYTSPSPRD